MTPPDELLDNEGYPTDEWLEFLRKYNPGSNEEALKFVKEVLPDGWYYWVWGVKLRRKYRGRRILELHTGGWSGNEDVINAMLSNMYLTGIYMQYMKWYRGGHYYFEIRA